MCMCANERAKEYEQKRQTTYDSPNEVLRMQTEHSRPIDWDGKFGISRLFAMIQFDYCGLVVSILSSCIAVDRSRWLPMQKSISVSHATISAFIASNRLSMIIAFAAWRRPRRRWWWWLCLLTLQTHAHTANRCKYTCTWAIVCCCYGWICVRSRVWSFSVRSSSSCRSTQAVEEGLIALLFWFGLLIQHTIVCSRTHAHTQAQWPQSVPQ